MSRSKRVAEQLGMPIGTAANRLRKIILFDLLQRYEENVCVRCQKRIMVVDDLSIEHIKPWEGISADLFWDLKNIAFSHLGCNRPHRHNGGGQNRKQPPEGMAWCCGCQDFLPSHLFWVDAAHWNKLSEYCKSCKEERKTDR